MYLPNWKTVRNASARNGKQGMPNDLNTSVIIPVKDSPFELVRETLRPNPAAKDTFPLQFPDRTTFTGRCRNKIKSLSLLLSQTNVQQQ